MKWWIAGLTLTGLLLGGSEGAWWPWPNIAGLSALLISAALMRRLEVD